MNFEKILRVEGIGPEDPLAIMTLQFNLGVEIIKNGSGFYCDNCDLILPIRFPYYFHDNQEGKDASYCPFCDKISHSQSSEQDSSILPQ